MENREDLLKEEIKKLKNQINHLEKIINEQNVTISQHIKEKSELKTNLEKQKQKVNDLKINNSNLRDIIKNNNDLSENNSLIQSSINEKKTVDNFKKNKNIESDLILPKIQITDVSSKSKSRNNSSTPKKKIKQILKRNRENRKNDKQERASSISNKIEIGKKLKNINYKQFMNKFSNKEDKAKIKSLMDLCSPMENPLKKKKNKNSEIKKRKKNSTNKINPKNLEISQKDNKSDISIIKEESVNDLSTSKISSSINLKKEHNFEQIFSEFLIIGCNKSKLHEYISKKEIEYKIIYSSDNKKKKEDDLIQFFVPFKQKIRTVRINNTISELNEILFQDKNQKYDFFSLCLNSNIETKNFDFKNFHILKDSNSKLFKYYYIAKVQDYFIEGDYLSKNNENNHIYLNYHSKYYVFETFYPLSNFYESLLKNYIMINKKKRIEKFMKNIKTGIIKSGNLEKIDSFNMEDEDIKTFLDFKKELLDIKIQKNYSEKFQIKLKTNEIDLNLPTKKFCPFISSEIGFSNILSNFTFEEFLFIYLSIIHEKNVIFVSKKNFRISCAISTFLNLLKPFNWEFPVIYNLPDDCLSMLGSPIPLIIGLKNSSQNVLSHFIPKFTDDSNSSNVFVFIDEKLIYYDYDILKDIIIPEYDEFYPKLKKLYHKNFNKESSSHFKISSKKVNGNKIHYFRKKNPDNLKDKFLKIAKGLPIKKKSKLFADLRISSKVLLKIETKQIFYFFKYFFQNFILSKIHYEKDEVIMEDVTNLEEIDVDFFSNNQADIDFLNSFFKTQSFVQYLEKEFYK